MSATGASPTSTSGNAATPATQPTQNVWTQLLTKSTRRGKESNSTLLMLGDKQSTTILNKFADRASNDVALTNPLLAGLGSEYGVDYGYTSVRPAASDDVLARLHLWSLHEPAHIEIIPNMILANQTPNEADIASKTTPTQAQPVQASTLATTIVVIAFDLSEPWRAIETIKTWLQGLQKVIQPLLASLPPNEAQALQTKISKHVQGYHRAQTLAAASAASAIGEEDEKVPDDSDAPPIDTNIPLHNLGLPLVFVGLRGDQFSRHLPSKSGADEQFEFLTRQIRKLALEWGAALIYTSVGRTAGGGGRGNKDSSVNVDLLQHYLYHRLYNFPLQTTSSSHTNSQQQQSSDDAPSPSSSAANGAVSPSSRSSLVFPPKVVGGTDDYAIFLPSGYDSIGLLETTSKNAVAAAFSDSTPIEEVFKGAGGSKKSALVSSSKSTSQPRRFDTLHADENTIFFKNLKHALENSGSSTGATVGATPALPTLTIPRKPATQQPLPSPTSLPSPSANIAAPIGAAGDKSTPTSAGGSGSSSVGVAGASVAAPGAAPAKGQTAVKQFFKSLLSNTSKPEGNTKAAAAQKAVRANAEKELQRMTDGQNQA